MKLPLVIIGLLALAAGDDPLARLASESFEVWHGAVLELAPGDARVVADVAKAVASGRVPPLHAEALFQTLTNPGARRALWPLLSSEHRVLRAAAAFALGELKEPAAAPALGAALEREPDGEISLTLARALWQVAPGEPSAELVVAVARKAPARARHALFDLVDPRILRAKIGAEERLGYLLGHVLPERVAGTEALSVQLGSRDPAEQLASDDDLAFLEARREELSRLLLEALERDRSAWAALLLGQLKDERALPLLRDAFLDVHDFWGWETSRPCPLEERQYPVRHAFEQAILHITGKPLAAVLQITTPEIWSCARKPDGLYVLFRLKPEAALEMAASRFRKDPRDPNQCCSRLELADALAEHLLRPGLSSGHLRVLLGRPARIAGETWRYAVGETTTPLELELRFAKGLLVSSGVVAAEKVP